MINHTTNAIPCLPDQPIIYRLADGITRMAVRADELAWQDLPRDEGRVVEFAPLLAGPWRHWLADRHHAIELPVMAETIVEVQLEGDEALHIAHAGDLLWSTGPDGFGSICRYRVLSPVLPLPGSPGPLGGALAKRTRCTPNRRPRKHVGPWSSRAPKLACPRRWAM